MDQKNNFKIKSVNFFRDLTNLKKTNKKVLYFYMRFGFNDSIWGSIIKIPTTN